MAIFLSPGNQILSLKLALISSGVLSVAVILKLTVPLFTGFSVTETPSIYTNFSFLLRPPYLYLVVNCIIISIVASSKLHKTQNAAVKVAASAAAAASIAGDVRTEYLSESHDDVYGDISRVVVASARGYAYGYDGDDDERVVKVSDHHPRVESVDVSYDQQVKQQEMDGGDAILRATVKIDSMELAVMDEKFEAFKEKVKEKERPLPSARFHHRKYVKASPEAGNGKALRVSKPKRQGTLESTWKTITEGRSMPLTRHLKKSDTWDTHVRSSNDQITPPKCMKKSETFTGSDRTGTPNSAGGLRREPSVKLKREPSLSQDELNKRVEAFINKFNEEMRLQRQQSLMQYQEMLRRGEH